MDITYSSEVLAASPFVYTCQISQLERIKMFILTVLLFPIRAVASATAFFLVLFFSKLMTLSYSHTSLPVPRSDFRRRYFMPMITFIARAVYFCGGIHWIEVKGQMASREQAPILVLGPHSSFLDSLAVVFLGMLSVVTTTAHRDSWFGPIITVLQPISVDRRDPHSRRKAMDEICQRAHSSDDWPQLVVFPEGTCTNRNALITFKQGAFQAGVPVQPIVLRWPNAVDCSTWTWDGPGPLKLLWMALTQFHVRHQIEFLPVYVPNEEEKRNPHLYGENVRHIMADALKLPMCDLTVADFRRIQVAVDSHMPIPDAMGCLHSLLPSIFNAHLGQELSAGRISLDERLMGMLLVARSRATLNTIEFSNILFPLGKTDLHEAALFNILVKYYSSTDPSEHIQFRRFMIHVCAITYASSPLTSLHYAVRAFEQCDRFIVPTNFPSTKQSWPISLQDARQLVTEFMQIALHDAIVDKIMNHVTTEYLSDDPNLDAVFYDQLYEAMYTTVPELVCMYQNYESSLKQVLGKYGQSFSATWSCSTGFDQSSANHHIPCPGHDKTTPAIYPIKGTEPPKQSNANFPSTPPNKYASRESCSATFRRTITSGKSELAGAIQP